MLGIEPGIYSTTKWDSQDYIERGKKKKSKQTDLPQCLEKRNLPHQFQDSEVRARVTDLGFISDPRPMNLQREQHRRINSS